MLTGAPGHVQRLRHASQLHTQTFVLLFSLRSSTQADEQEIERVSQPPEHMVLAQLHPRHTPAIGYTDQRIGEFFDPHVELLLLLHLALLPLGFAPAQFGYLLGAVGSLNSLQGAAYPDITDDGYHDLQANRLGQGIIGHIRGEQHGKFRSVRANQDYETDKKKIASRHHKDAHGRQEGNRNQFRDEQDIEDGQICNIQAHRHGKQHHATAQVNHSDKQESDDGELTHAVQDQRDTAER